LYLFENLGTSSGAKINETIQQEPNSEAAGIEAGPTLPFLFLQRLSNCFVWMVLETKFAIFGTNFILRSASIQTEDFIRIDVAAEAR
jgi:hypothetical protein